MPHRPVQLHGDKSRVCSDPVIVQRYEADPLCHRWVTAAFGAALDEGRAEVLPLGHELDRPMLLLESGTDTVVDPDAIGSPVVRRASGAPGTPPPAGAIP